MKWIQGNFKHLFWNFVNCLVYTRLWLEVQKLLKVDQCFLEKISLSTSIVQGCFLVDSTKSLLYWFLPVKFLLLKNWSFLWEWMFTFFSYFFGKIHLTLIQKFQMIAVIRYTPGYTTILWNHTTYTFSTSMVQRLHFDNSCDDFIQIELKRIIFTVLTF